MMHVARAISMQTLSLTGFRPKRRLVFFTAGLALAIILTFYELSASRWVWLAKELANSPPTFYLPLDTQSKGLQTGLETDPIGQTILWGYGPNSRLRFSTSPPCHCGCAMLSPRPSRAKRSMCHLMESTWQHAPTQADCAFPLTPATRLAMISSPSQGKIPFDSTTAHGTTVVLISPPMSPASWL